MVYCTITLPSLSLQSGAKRVSSSGAMMMPAAWTPVLRESPSSRAEMSRMFFTSGSVS